MATATLSIADSAQAAEEILELLIMTRNKACRTLLKDPDDATHSSWHLWLPPHFNTSLDLRFIGRQQVKDKVIVCKWKEWAQGSSFCFNEGAIIYDRDVSGLSTWGDKLKAIDFYVVIGATEPVSLRTISGVEASNESAGYAVDRYPGSVAFNIYVPSEGIGSILSSEHTVTQDEFVRFAITGRF